MALLLPLFLGWLKLTGEQFFHYSNAFGVSLVAASNIFFYSFLLFLGARSVKKAENKRKLVEEKFRTLFQSSSDAIMILSPPDWKFLECNPATLKLFNIKDNVQFSSLGPWDLSPKFQPDAQLSSVKAKKMIELAMKDGSSSFEWRHKKFNGEEFSATVLLTKMVIGGEAVLQGIVRDVTELHKEKERVAALAKEWAQTFDAMSDGVSIHAVDHTILNANAALCKMLGKKKEEIIGQKCYVIFHDTDCPIGSCPMERAIISKKDEQLEVFEPKLNGWLLISTSPIFDGKGELEKLVHVVRDITERKKTEKELEEKNKKLLELDKLKSDFIATVSHELRTPLTIIKEGIMQVLDELYGKIGTDQKKVLDISKNNIDRLTRIINDLLDISKIEANRVDIHPKEFPICEIGHKVIEASKIKADAEGIRMVADCSAGENVLVYADPDRLEQIFINLITNSLKFTPKGGQITLKLEEEPDFVRISVSDTGKGIAGEDIPKLFSRFQQLDRSKGGTGLGLAIAKNLVELQGGKIWVESELGKGTTFTFTVPKVKK
ncbi:hypothetical protein A2276_04710 [candidate division WOR-1 bacterium RIFOXYA12_FULL_43_27]|nr:MAG: hypothetical protein A2276_04710 [candidate division WOR-1 bacterium RIFOXYA12_FULL_43_27]